MYIYYKSKRKWDTSLCKNEYDRSVMYKVTNDKDKKDLRKDLINIHPYFLHDFQPFESDADKYFGTAISKGIKEVYFSGVSEGGAMASIAAHQFITNMENPHSLSNIKLNLITLGAPKVGTKKFADTLDKYITGLNVRILGKKDIPPILIEGPYVHAGNEVIVDKFPYKFEFRPKIIREETKEEEEEIQNLVKVKTSTHKIKNFIKTIGGFCNKISPPSEVEKNIPSLKKVAEIDVRFVKKLYEQHLKSKEGGSEIKEDIGSSEIKEDTESKDIEEIGSWSQKDEEEEEKFS